jgi:Ser/Thr protein kinase RdoA (MazF antagonist)
MRDSARIAGMKPSQAVKEFNVRGRLVYIDSINRGNVNDTYEAVFRAGAAVQRIILQRINRRVFPRPDWIMENMRKVTDHVMADVERDAGAAGREWGFPQVIPTKAWGDFFLDDEGEYWRALTMVDASTSYAKVRNAEHAREAGMVLGCFHRMISDVDIAGLHDPLPGFHILPEYLRKYDETVADTASEERLRGSAEVGRLREFVEARRGDAGILENAKARGELRTRLIHGDPKVDNIMMDDFTGKGIAIVDLDTVKPGLVQYDFGDALRSLCNPAGEDESDLANVSFDVGLCEAFVRGYFVHAREFLTEADHRYLFDSIRLIAFELGLRFFQDYLAGDVYFKVRFEEHNLNRARVQFKLCESVEINENGIRKALGFIA